MNDERINEIREEAVETRAACKRNPGTWLGDYPLEDLEFLLAYIDELHAELERLKREV